MSKKKKKVPQPGEKEKLALEKQLVKEGKIFPRARYAPRGRFRGVLALCLAFLFGILAGIGCLVGAGYYIGTRKLRDVFSLVNMDVTNYVSEAYAEESLFTLISDIATKPITNFNSLAEYTPLVWNTVEQMSSQFSELGVALDIDDFMEVPFAELGSYFRDDVIMKAELGKVLNIHAGSDPVMVSLCYGKNGVDYRIEDGVIVMNEGKSPTKLEALVNDASGIVGDMSIGDVVAISDSSSPIMQAIKDWSVSDLNNSMRINRLRIKQVVTLGSNPSSMLNAIKDWRIGELSDQSKVNSLKLKEVITINDGSSRILRALADCSLGELNNKAKTLRLNEIMDPAVLESNRILKHLANSSVDTLSDDLKALSVGQVFGDRVYSYLSTRGEHGENGDVTYQSIFDDYFNDDHYKNKDYNTAAHRPTAIANVTNDPTFEAYRVHGETRVTLGYFRRDGESFTPLKEGETAQYDPAIARDNRNAAAAPDPENPVQPRTPWYTERKIVLTPVYGYLQVNFDAGTLDPLAEGRVRETDEGLLYTDAAGNGHLLSEDDYSLYYIDDETGKRFDFDRTVSSYTDENGDAVTLDPVTQTWKNGAGETVVLRHESAALDGEGNLLPAYDYYDLREEVFERYTDGEHFYEEKDTVEKYEYTPAKSGDTPVELDRYVSGVWYILLAKEEGEGDERHTVLQTSLPILELDSLISGISSAINDTRLCELWFHGILKDNPYVELKVEIEIESERGEPKEPDLDGKKYLKVNNLIEVTLGETVALVKGLAGKLPG